MLLNWSDEELIAVGLDPLKVKSLVRRLNKRGREMQTMGLHVYGASGSGHLVHGSRPTHTEGGAPHQENPVASLDGAMLWDGGDW